jgi:hypothetical protein
MHDRRTLVTVQSRNFSAHHLLIHASRRSYERAAQEEVGRLYEILTAMVFSALSIEALSNSVGERVIENWVDFESASPLAKLRVLCISLNIPFDITMKPWSRVKALARFRNLVAHAKPELIEETHHLTEQEHEKRLFDMPSSRMEKMLTLGNAKEYLDTAETIKDLLIANIPTDKSLGLAVDSWSGSVSLRDLKS